MSQTIILLRMKSCTNSVWEKISTLSPVTLNLISYLCICCTMHLLFFLLTKKFLCSMPVKYQESTMERSVSHLVPVFCPCRALTSLMKTWLPSCLFSCVFSRGGESWAQAVSNKRTLLTRPRQRRCFAPPGSCFGLELIPRTCKTQHFCCQFAKFQDEFYINPVMELPVKAEFNLKKTFGCLTV